VHEDPVVARAEDTKPTEAATAAGDDNVNGSGTSTQVATREPGAAQVAGSENWFLTPILNTIAAPFMALAPLLVFMVAPPLALIMAFTTLSRKTWQNSEFQVPEAVGETAAAGARLVLTLLSDARGATAVNVRLV
jgi:hypothetical protein